MLLIIVACDQGHKAPAPPPPVPAPLAIPPARPRTCDEVRPEHDEMLRAQQHGFETALAAKHLAVLRPEHLWISSEAGSNVDRFTVMTTQHRRVLASAIHDRAYGDEPAADLVSDGTHVWIASKQLRPTSTKTIEVATCQWGCFVPPPSGEERRPDNGRDAWVLRDGQTYEGELVVEYDGPEIVFKPTLSCGSPP